LVRTITTVKRFQMLLSGADQLEQMLTHTQYRPAASLLQVNHSSSTASFLSHENNHSTQTFSSLQALNSLIADISQQLPVSLWPPAAQKLQLDVQRCKEQLFLKILAVASAASLVPHFVLSLKFIVHVVTGIQKLHARCHKC
jgi:hypothetical protein